MLDMDNGLRRFERRYPFVIRLMRLDFIDFHGHSLALIGSIYPLW